jgi:bacterioferritin-associated ferredoxin
MNKFKETFTQGIFQRRMDSASSSLGLKRHVLFLKIDSKDIVNSASYLGPPDPWLENLCSLILEKDTSDLSILSWNDLDEAFKNDLSYWEFKKEASSDIWFEALELLRGVLDQHRGRDYLYHDPSPLICRCFGVRESDVLQHLREEKDASIDSLGLSTKAGQGCRTCVRELKRWMAIYQSGPEKRVYKEKKIADWLLEIDYMLSCFPQASSWKMEVVSFKKNQVVVSYEREVTQKEEEVMTVKLQDFLGRGVDSDLGFFLRRARHESKASG